MRLHALFRRSRRECVLFTHPQSSHFHTTTCRFNKRTDNFSQRAKPISVAIYLRISSFLIKLPQIYFSLQKNMRVFYHISSMNTSVPPKKFHCATERNLLITRMIPFSASGGRIRFRGSFPSRRHSSVRLHSGDSLGTGAADAASVAAHAHRMPCRLSGRSSKAHPSPRPQMHSSILTFLLCSDILPPSVDSFCLCFRQDVWSWERRRLACLKGRKMRRRNA